MNNGKETKPYLQSYNDATFSKTILKRLLNMEVVVLLLCTFI